MFKLLMILLLVAAAFVTGAWYNERSTTNTVSRAVHQAKNRVEAIRQDLVARSRNRASDHEQCTVNDPTRAQMMREFQHVLQLIRQDMQHKQVAVSGERHDNKHNDND